MDVVLYEHVFPYQRIDDTSNETDTPNIHDHSPFAEYQHVLSQPSQVIFAYCDNVHNNDYESNIQVLEEVFFHKDQNLNKNHY